MTQTLHLKRVFLEKTETFVYSQLTFLPPEHAVALVRIRKNQRVFPYGPIYAFTDEGRGLNRALSDGLYRLGKWMIPYERHFYSARFSDLTPRLVHAHFAVDAAYFLPVLATRSTPLVVSCYGYDVSSFPGRYHGFGRRYLEGVWRRASLVLAMSQDMSTDLVRLGCRSEKIAVHYHGIDLARFPYSGLRGSVQPLTILSVGSLSDERKRVDDTIRAFRALVAQTRVPVRLRIVGEGRYRPRLERLTRDLGLERLVDFVGFVQHDRLAGEMERADIFCHPSATTRSGDKEGIPGTIVEAMATGLPVVSTRHAGIPEMVQDGVTGFLSQERDVDGIARGLSILVENEEVRQRLGEAGAGRTREVADAARQAVRLEKLYAQVLASSRPASPTY